MITPIIVNHNTREHLSACLDSIRSDPPVETVVVDNASSDGSTEMIRADFPWVTLLENQDNGGYGAAANQGIAQCRGEAVLLLNSDTRLLPGAIQALAAHLDRHPQVAVVGPRLLNPDGTLQPSCYPFPSPMTTFLEETTLWRLAARLPFVQDRYLRSWSHSYYREVPWVLGAALALRRRAFLSVGGFDESFFMYAEETDLCYRLRSAGWLTHFTPAATIVHHGGASTSAQREKMAVQYFLSLLHFHQLNRTRRSFRHTLWVMKTIVFARYLRDIVRYRIGPVRKHRSNLAADITAWRQILDHRGSWASNQ